MLPPRSALRLVLLALGTAPLLSTASCASGPNDEEALGETSSAVKNCPVTDPDYPTCAPVDRCEGATATLSAAPPSIALGGTSTLRWNITRPVGCVAAATLAGQTIANLGSLPVSPMTETTYALKLGGRTLASLDVEVTLPSTVRINGSTIEWRRLLIAAIQTPNTRVVLSDNVDMDMSNLENIYVREGVTLTSEVPPPVLSKGVVPPGPVFEQLPSRNGQNLGPRLFTTTKPKPLFYIRCNEDHALWGDDVRFAGFRLQGPHFDTEEGNDNLENGIRIDSCLNVEIDNMELSGFSGQAVAIYDELLRQINPSAVSVHDSYIHNNQHASGNGYGVLVSDHAWAKIERNVFDFNRHAITASGAPGVGYAAERNLVLKGGGHHGTWYNEHTHQFDVYGDANCPDIPFNQHTWNCGNAGEQFWLKNNAFQFTKDRAIKLRGVPRIRSYITGNVFAHDSVGDAVETKSDVNVNIENNTANVDPFGHYGVCDFDGDGRDDLFLATGNSWWYSSAGRVDWRYLGARTEQLHQVGLGDFNGDGRCDVFAVNAGNGGWEIASGGSGAWTALPGTGGVPFSELRFGDFNGDKVMDVFRRAPDGGWWAISPGRYGWTALGSSSFALDDLRFGDFNGNGITDILRRSGSTWVISLDARSTWQPWGPNGDDVKSLLVGNVDGIAGDDVLRYVVTGTNSGRWDISSGGRGSWRTYASMSWPELDPLFPGAREARSFIGRFDASGGADLLAIDITRYGKRFDAASGAFVPHSLYAF